VKGEWGDRRQEIVFIGGGLDALNHELVMHAFDSCLLTNAEMKKWEKAMRKGGTEAEIKERLEELFEDGFEGEQPATRRTNTFFFWFTKGFKSCRLAGRWRDGRG
jgi:hypothetical protein